jgi:hypothetical protein
MKCRQSGRAAIRHLRPSCPRWAAAESEGRDPSPQERSAPTSFATLTIELVPAQPRETADDATPRPVRSSCVACRQTGEWILLRPQADADFRR